MWTGRHTFPKTFVHFIALHDFFQRNRLLSPYLSRPLLEQVKQRIQRRHDRHNHQIRDDPSPTRVRQLGAQPDAAVDDAEDDDDAAEPDVRVRPGGAHARDEELAVVHLAEYGLQRQQAHNDDAHHLVVGAPLLFCD